jgi:hypothetical protein
MQRHLKTILIAVTAALFTLIAALIARSYLVAFGVFSLIITAAYAYLVGVGDFQNRQDPDDGSVP